MAPKYHPMPLSGGDRKALKKELARSGGIAQMLKNRSHELRTRAEAMLREADSLYCQFWNEKMWAEGGPVDPSPTINEAINGSYPWLEIECSRCRTRRDVDLAVLKTPSTTFVHDLGSRLRCQKCAGAGKRPSATLLQLAPRARHRAPEE